MLMLVVGNAEDDSFSEFVPALLEHDDVSLLWAETAEKALSLASQETIDLVVADETLDDMTGLDLAGRLLSVNPMINCALISSLSPERFHEVSEGLGVMDQLPVRPERSHAEDLLQRLRHIKDLAAGVGRD